MSHNSRNRDTYAAKAMIASKGNAKEFVKLLDKSPFSMHKKEAQALMTAAKAFAKREAEGAWKDSSD